MLSQIINTISTFNCIAVEANPTISVQPVIEIPKNLLSISLAIDFPNDDIFNQVTKKLITKDSFISIEEINKIIKLVSYEPVKMSNKYINIPKETDFEFKKFQKYPVVIFPIKNILYITISNIINEEGYLYNYITKPEFENRAWKLIIRLEDDNKTYSVETDVFKLDGEKQSFEKVELEEISDLTINPVV